MACLTLKLTSRLVVNTRSALSKADIKVVGGKHTLTPCIASSYRIRDPTHAGATSTQAKDSPRTYRAFYLESPGLAEAPSLNGGHWRTTKLEGPTRLCA
eukprot:1160283-Pelagomonas_calceolata.AAC.4